MVKKEQVLEYLRKNPQALKDEFSIKPRAKTIKKTFELSDELLKEFYDEAHKRGLKIKTAIDQAIRGWLQK